MIVIIDYDMGNVASVANMLKRVGVTDVVLSKDTETIRRAEKLILPGVGAFDNGMANLEKNGLVDVLTEKVIGEGVPLLGICLGLQLLGTSSEEGEKPGLGWIDARAVRFPTGNGLKVPHMGWNYVTTTKANSILPTETRQRYYFVHSYYMECDSTDDVLATARYGLDFTCAVQRGNITGVQFHPEKSHRFGMAVLERFAALKPRSREHFAMLDAPTRAPAMNLATR